MTAVTPYACAKNDQIVDKETSEAELKVLQKDIKKLDRWIGQAKSEEKGLKLQLRNTEIEINTLIKQVNVMRQSIINSRLKIGTLKKEQTALFDTLNNQKGLLISQIRMAYSMGKKEFLKVMLNQEDAATITRNLKYYEYVHRSRLNRIDELKTTLDKLNTVEQAMQAEIATLNHSKLSLDTKKETLLSSKNERKKVLDLLQANISDNDDKLKKLKTDQSKLQELITQVESAFADIPVRQDNQTFLTRKGNLSWPSKGKRSAYVTVSDKKRIVWDGLIIQGKEGSPIKAIHHGRVVFSDWLRGYGLLLIIDHGDGYMSLYARNQALLKETGDWVSSGETIAALGGSGGFPDTALYFELRQNGKPIKTSRWFK